MTQSGVSNVPLRELRPEAIPNIVELIAHPDAFYHLTEECGVLLVEDVLVINSNGYRFFQVDDKDMLPVGSSKCGTPIAVQAAIEGRFVDSEVLAFLEPTMNQLEQTKDEAILMVNSLSLTEILKETLKGSPAAGLLLSFFVTPLEILLMEEVNAEIGEAVMAHDEYPARQETVSYISGSLILELGRDYLNGNPFEIFFNAEAGDVVAQLLMEYMSLEDDEISQLVFQGDDFAILVSKYKDQFSFSAKSMSIHDMPTDDFEE